jgi:hypothetical protein
MLCWRANRPQGSQLTDYVNMLNLGLVQPVGMQLYYMMIDDPNSVQMIGPFNGTSFAPSFLPVRRNLEPAKSVTEKGYFSINSRTILV